MTRIEWTKNLNMTSCSYICIWQYISISASVE